MLKPWIKLIVLVAVLATLPDLLTPRIAEAGCEYLTEVTVTYWEVPQNVGPPLPAIIGECTTNCDNITSCWGRQESQYAGYYNFESYEFNSCSYPYCTS